LSEHHLASGNIYVPQATCLRNGQPQTGHLAVFTPHASHKRIKRDRRHTVLCSRRRETYAQESAQMIAA
jgi:hypothetical protein